MWAIVQRVLVLSVTLVSASAQGWEFEGEVFSQLRLFGEAPDYPGQASQNQSIAVELSAYHEFSKALSFEFVPFFRQDFQDDERSHGDIRQAYALWAGSNVEVGVGINKVFWGVTEAQHLVDIINQTDAIEALDQEEKLGQPMLSLSLPIANGLVDIYLMPYFRERTFAGKDGRLRPAIVIDTDNPVYEHPNREHHLDWAVRLKQSFQQTEFALSYFEGTGRDPSIIRSTTLSESVLAPYYPQIRQFGFEAQYIRDAWLWKLETIYREGQPNLQFSVDNYYAVTGGFEYNMYAIFNTTHDLGIILEGIYDERRDLALSAQEEDIVLGTRWTLNNLNSTEILALWIQDADTSAHNLVLEFSMHYGKSVAITLEALMFSGYPGAESFNDLKADQLGGQLRQDDYLQIEVGYFF